MTLLHQAAQKAVEAPEYKPAGAPMEVWNSPFYDLQTRLEICAGAVAFEREVSANMRRQRDEARAALSALQQQPEPADSLLASHLAYTRAHLPALQQQEVPREPVADFDTWQQNPYTKVLMDSIKNDYMPRADAEALIRAAASPSTTRQQEVGSAKPPSSMGGDQVFAAQRLSDPAAAPSTPENAGGVVTGGEGQR